MAIVSLDQLLASARQDNILIVKTATRTTVANTPYSLFDVAGSPSGTLAVGNTANGLVHTDATNGYPVLDVFGGSNTGYLTRLEYGNATVACVMQLFDRLFSCGAYAFNAGTVNLTAQPSYAGRVPGANYKGLEIWFEAVTAFTGNLSLAVTYTNQDGTTGRTTGTVAFGVAPGLGRMVRLPLQAGDTGVQKIESVTPSVSTAGTFNVHVMRRLGPAARVVANGVVVYDAFQLQWPVVYDTSALFLMVQADGTGSGLPYCNMNIANG